VGSLNSRRILNPAASPASRIEALIISTDFAKFQSGKTFLFIYPEISDSYHFRSHWGHFSGILPSWSGDKLILKWHFSPRHSKEIASISSRPTTIFVSMVTGVLLFYCSASKEQFLKCHPSHLPQFSLLLLDLYSALSIIAQGQG